MSSKHFRGVVVFGVLGAFGGSAAWGLVTIPTVPIGHIGNLADPTTGLGAVGYGYRIGTTEVTNEQYAAFLNAVAATDANGLYNEGMAATHGGIVRSGVSGSYAYATVDGRASHPVNFVSFWDGVRFSNWLHNGQPTGAQNAGSTEDGAYTITQTELFSTVRNTGARWAVTSEDEWFKAAYFEPAVQGSTSNYWPYPTSTLFASTSQANFFNVIGDTAPVASYAGNYFGAFDMGGNVFEWNEAGSGGPERGLRGGAFSSDAYYLRADSRLFDDGFFEDEARGFRVVEVPAPSAAVVMIGGGVLALRRRARR